MLSHVNSHFAANIKFLRERKGLSQQDLSLALGMTRAKIAAYEIGHTKNPSIQDLNILSEYFLVSIDDLLKQEISKLPEYKLKLMEDGKLTGASLRVVVTTVTSTHKENIEFVPVKAKAGYVTGYGDPDFISTLPTFDLPHLPKDKKYRMFPTHGDSMLPIPEGALIIGEYVEDWLSIKEGLLYIVVTKREGIVFKQIAKSLKDRHSLILSSLNTLYSPYTVFTEEILEVWKYKCFISDNIPIADTSSVQQVYEEIKSVKTDLKKILVKISA